MDTRRTVTPPGRTTKQTLRERIWRRLERRHVARFPLPLHDRIPNFAGAEAAAARLAGLPEWKAARRQHGHLDARTPAVTTVHDLQVVEHLIPMTAHDVAVDVVVTATRVIRTGHRLPRPRGIRWSALSAAQVEAMPPLRAPRRRGRARG